MFAKTEIRVVLMILINRLKQVSRKGHRIFTHLHLNSSHWPWHGQIMGMFAKGQGVRHLEL